jgi:hypothetical protein
VVLFALAALSLDAQTQDKQTPAPPLPDIRELMKEVQAHQKLVEKERENDTYTSLITTQDLDANGKVTKTESEEDENFFVNSHLIARTVKKNGQPLGEHEEQKETERVTKLVEKAQNTPPGQPIEGQTISISRMLEIMDVRNPRRENYRGRSTIVFDFIGRKDAKTHGVIEDASKKTAGHDLDRRGRQAGGASRSELQRQLPRGGRRVCHGAKGIELSFRPGAGGRRRMAAHGRRRRDAGAAAGLQEPAPALHRARIRLQTLQRGDRSIEGCEAGAAKSAVKARAGLGLSGAMRAQPLGTGLLKRGQRVTRMFSLACADQSTLCGKIRQIASRGGRRCAGNCAVISRA